jgi:hypothetical protein
MPGTWNRGSVWILLNATAILRRRSFPSHVAAPEPSWSSLVAASLRAPPPPSRAGARQPPSCRLPLRRRPELSWSSSAASLRAPPPPSRVQARRCRRAASLRWTCGRARARRSNMMTLAAKRRSSRAAVACMTVEQAWARW